MRSLIPMAVAGLLLALAPAAYAQETNETRPDDAAWVEDCPPDMMCAAGAEDAPQDNATYGDCGGEVCAYGDEGCIECSGPVDERPQELGPEGCIDCMGPVDGGSNCMDGAQENETCRDDVQYLDGRGPEGCENCRGDDAGEPINSHQPAEDVATQGESAKDVPALGVAAMIVGIGAALIFVAPRK